MIDRRPIWGCGHRGIKLRASEGRPHLRDAEEVFERIKRRPGTVYRALVPNAAAPARPKARVDEMLGLITISATIPEEPDRRRRGNRAESRIVSDCGIEPLPLSWRSHGFWCAYEGLISEDDVIAVVRRLHEGGIRRFYSQVRSHGRSATSTAVTRSARVSGCGVRIHVHNYRAWRPQHLAALDAACNGWKADLRNRGIAMPKSSARSAIFPRKIWWRCWRDGIETGIDPERTASCRGDFRDAGHDRSHRANGATRKSVANRRHNHI